MIFIKKAEIIREFKALYGLRYETYSSNHQGVDLDHYPEKIEKDDFDAFAVHFIALNPNRDIIGTIRLLNDAETPGGLPIKSHPGLFSKSLSTLRSAEVSRLAVDARHKEKVIFLGLLRSLYHYCLQKRITSVLFAIEIKTYQFLNDYGFQLKPVGKAELYLNRHTLPAKWDFSEMQSSLRLKNPQFYQWLQKESDVISNEFALLDLLRPASSSSYNYMTIARG